MFFLLTGSWLNLPCNKRQINKRKTNRSLMTCILLQGSPSNSVSKESACNAGDCLLCRKCRFNPWVRKIPWRRKWQPTPVFLPGKSHGQRNLAGYSPWGHKRVRHNLAIKQQQHTILDLNYQEGPSHGKSGGRTWGAFRESPKGVPQCSQGIRRTSCSQGYELEEIYEMRSQRWEGAG